LQASKQAIIGPAINSEKARHTAHQAIKNPPQFDITRAKKSNYFFYTSKTNLNLLFYKGLLFYPSLYAAKPSSNFICLN